MTFFSPRAFRVSASLLGALLLYACSCVVLGAASVSRRFLEIGGTHDVPEQPDEDAAALLNAAAQPEISLLQAQFGRLRLLDSSAEGAHITAEAAEHLGRRDLLQLRAADRGLRDFPFLPTLSKMIPDAPGRVRLARKSLWPWGGVNDDDFGREEDALNGNLKNCEDEETLILNLNAPLVRKVTSSPFESATELNKNNCTTTAEEGGPDSSRFIWKSHVEPVICYSCERVTPLVDAVLRNQPATVARLIVELGVNVNHVHSVLFHEEPRSRASLVPMGRPPAEDEFGNNTTTNDLSARRVLELNHFSRRGGSSEDSSWSSAKGDGPLRLMRYASSSSGRTKANVALDMYRFSALHVALALGNSGMVELLLQHGADPNLRCGRTDVSTPSFHHHADSNISNSSSSSQRSESGERRRRRHDMNNTAGGMKNKGTTGRRACGCVKCNRLRSAVAWRRGNPLDSRLSEPLPLHLAVHLGLEGEFVKLLKAFGAKIGETGKDGKGRLPLHIAASKGRSDLLEELLVVRGLQEEGISTVDAADSMGRTPLHLAVSSGRFEVAKLLVEKFGANLEKRDACGRTPLARAVWAAAEYAFAAGRERNLSKMASAAVASRFDKNCLFSRNDFGEINANSRRCCTGPSSCLKSGKRSNSGSPRSCGAAASSAQQGVSSSRTVIVKKAQFQKTYRCPLCDRRSLVFSESGGAFHDHDVSCCFSDVDDTLESFLRTIGYLVDAGADVCTVDNQQKNLLDYVRHPLADALLHFLHVKHVPAAGSCKNHCGGSPSNSPERLGESLSMMPAGDAVFFGTLETRDPAVIDDAATNNDGGPPGFAQQQGFLSMTRESIADAMATVSVAARILSAYDIGERGAAGGQYVTVNRSELCLGACLGVMRRTPPSQSSSSPMREADPATELASSLGSSSAEVPQLSRSFAARAGDNSSEESLWRRFGCGGPSRGGGRDRSACWGGPLSFLAATAESFFCAFGKKSRSAKAGNGEAEMHAAQMGWTGTGWMRPAV